MNKHTILVRSSAFKTQRVSRQARFLLEQGNKVTILSWDRHYTSGAEQKTKDALMEQGVEIISFQHTQEYGKGLGGILSRLKWAYFVANTVNKQDCEHVCFVDLDSMIAAFLVNNPMGGITFIADFADFIEEYPIKFGGIIKPLISILNKIIFNKFDHVFVPTELRLKPYMRGHEKVKIINNAPDVDKSINITRNGTILYCGTLGPDRGIKLICDALVGKNNLKFRVAGWGPLEKPLVELAGSKLTCLGHIDYNQVLLETAACDFVYCVYDPSVPVNKFSDPNKFYEAIHFGKPLIVARGTGIDRIVEKEKIGIVIDYNSDSLVECLEKTTPKDYEVFIKNINLCKQRFSSNSNKEKLIQVYS